MQKPIYWRIFRRPRYWLLARLWPSYECECCVGQEVWRGCYCAYYEAEAPGQGNIVWWRRWGRKVYIFVTQDRSLTRG